MKRMLRSLVASLMMMIPAAAFAADGYVITDVTMYAGPDVQYPAIQEIPANAWISVQGCTPGWEWCDVIAGPARGWVPGTYIAYMYESQPVYVVDYGAQIGIPIVTFAIGTYWGRYYMNRPFYRDRARWYGRPMPIRPPARPPMRPRPPIGRPPEGHRPPPGGGYRPPVHRPYPPAGNRPTPPGNDQRPPPIGHRPMPPRPSVPPGNQRPPGGDQRPPPISNRPQLPPGNRPAPPAGNRPPEGNRPQPKPAPRPHPPQGNNDNNGH